MTGPIKDLQELKSLFPGMEEYVPDEPDLPAEAQEAGPDDKAKAQMKLYVSRDKKHRGGKQVTLIEGHDGPPEAREALLARLKSLCSAGGSLKDAEIMIQGDHVKKVMEYLGKAGYRQVKRKGG